MNRRLSRTAMLCVAALCCAGTATGAPRGIRVEFGSEWGGNNEGVIGTAACPGTSAANVLVQWNGYTFSAQSDPQFGFNVDTYCQNAEPYEPGDSVSDYFNAASFRADESGLAAMVGANRHGQVSAIRYSYFGGPRFNDPNGFQWVFYSFPRQVTVVGLHGLVAIPLTNQYSYIEGPGGRVWNGGSDGNNGEYYCFRGLSGPGGTEHVYVGTWSGSIAETDNACLQLIATIHSDGFE